MRSANIILDLEGLLKNDDGVIIADFALRSLSRKSINNSGLFFRKIKDRDSYAVYRKSDRIEHKFKK